MHLTEGVKNQVLTSFYALLTKFFVLSSTGQGGQQVVKISKCPDNLKESCENI